jgi:hypothetical protein
MRVMAARRDGGRGARGGLALAGAGAVLALLCPILAAGVSLAADAGHPRGTAPGLRVGEPDGGAASYWTLYRQRRLMSDARLLDRLDLEFCAFRDAESRAFERRTGFYQDRPSGPAADRESLKWRGVFFEDDCTLFIRRHAEEHRAWYEEAKRSAHGDTVADWRDFCATADPRQPLHSLCRAPSDRRAGDAGRR